MRAFEERHGVRIMQAWGMTETSPIGAVARPPEGAEAGGALRCRVATGRIVPLVETRIVDDDGEELPWDGEATGEVEFAALVASDYYKTTRRDRRSSTTAGFALVRRVGRSTAGVHANSSRAKDLIKSARASGYPPWSSRTTLMSHPSVADAR